MDEDNFQVAQHPNFNQNQINHINNLIDILEDEMNILENDPTNPNLMAVENARVALLEAVEGTPFHNEPAVEGILQEAHLLMLDIVIPDSDEEEGENPQPHDAPPAPDPGEVGEGRRKRPIPKNIRKIMKALSSR